MKVKFQNKNHLNSIQSIIIIQSLLNNRKINGVVKRFATYIIANVSQIV